MPAIRNFILETEIRQKNIMKNGNSFRIGNDRLVKKLSKTFFMFFLRDMFHYTLFSIYIFEIVFD